MCRGIGLLFPDFHTVLELSSVNRPLFNNNFVVSSRHLFSFHIQEFLTPVALWKENCVL